MSEKRTTTNTGVGVAIGAGVGEALFAATSQPVWIGVGVAIGAALGAATGLVQDADDADEPDAADDNAAG